MTPATKTKSKQKAAPAPKVVRIVGTRLNAVGDRNEIVLKHAAKALEQMDEMLVGKDRTASPIVDHLAVIREDYAEALAMLRGVPSRLDGVKAEIDRALGML